MRRVPPLHSITPSNTRIYIMIKHLTRLTRPYQWVKNLFVLLPVFFGGAITDSLSLWHAAIAFMAYSLTASAIYCYNDIVDVEDDRRHAVKCHRPIASGAVSIKAGYLLMALQIGRAHV